ncbi:MAG: T9SS type A sorting domain-containing protein [Candidatus Cloacimonetes bacterium]|nr:T9SS type A sorting domain-containing protein [Candidatus Cloacimonadota bacterium]
MKVPVILIILLAGLLLNGQPAWEENTLIEESHYKYLWESASKDEVLYYTWVEEVGSGYNIKTQGVRVDQSNIWAEPVSQEISYGFPESVLICLGEDGSTFLYWKNDALPDSMECFLQKISSDGELLWGTEGIEIETMLYQFGFLSDNTGGLYCHSLYNDQELNWHLDADGEIVTGWENGIILGDLYRSVLAVSDAGNLAIFKRVTEIDEPGWYFQIVTGDGSFQYPGEGIFCGEYDYYNSGMIILESDEYLLAWEYDDNVFGNKILNNGEFLYPEPLILGNTGEGDHFYRIVQQGDDCYLCLYDNDTGTFKVMQFDEAWQMTGTCVDLPYTGYMCYSQIKPDGNILLGVRDPVVIRLIEYNAEGVLVSPPEGWLSFDGSDEYAISNDSQGDTYITREIIDDKGQSDFKAQIYDPDSAPVFEDDGFLICENKQLEPYDCQIFALPDKIVYCWYEWKNDKRMYKVQYLDNDGNPLLEDEGVTIIYRDVYQGYFTVLLKEENSMLLLEHIREDFITEYTRIHRIIFDDEPWLEWGEDGIEIEEINYNNVEAVKREDGSYLLYWQDNGHSRGQLIVDGETVLPDNYDLGLEGGNIISIKGDYCTYYTSYNIYLTRWNDLLEPVWDSPVWLTGRNYFEANSFEYIVGSNLVKYWISHECDQMQNYCWRLKKQVITPEGEKLLGNFAIPVYEDAEVEIRDFCYVEELDQIILICGGDGIFMMKYMSMEGDILSPEYFTFEDLGGDWVLDLYSEHGYLLAKTLLQEEYVNSIGLCVFDFAGNAIAGLPGPEFHIPDQSFSEIISDDRGIYYAWAEWHHEGNYYQAANGRDVYAQKIDFTANGVNDEQLAKITSTLGIYPNPFNPEVNISWQITKVDQDAGLSIYNIKGQKVREFEVSAKKGQITWDGRDTASQQCASGIYLIRMQNGSEKQTAKVLMLK